MLSLCILIFVLLSFGLPITFVLFCDFITLLLLSSVCMCLTILFLSLLFSASSLFSVVHNFVSSVRVFCFSFLSSFFLNFFLLLHSCSVFVFFFLLSNCFVLVRFFSLFRSRERSLFWCVELAVDLAWSVEGGAWCEG
jgi:hypothetical protein